jgi:hypothetical protein
MKGRLPAAIAVKVGRPRAHPAVECGSHTGDTLPGVQPVYLLPMKAFHGTAQKLAQLIQLRRESGQFRARHRV